MKVRLEIKNIHQKIMENERPKTLDDYIKTMKAQKDEVIPSINKANKLQGFGSSTKGQNFKASEVHRSMSGGRIMAQLSQNRGYCKTIGGRKVNPTIGKTLELSSNLATQYRQEYHQKTIRKNHRYRNRVLK